jgi:hypothetical protein
MAAGSAAGVQGAAVVAEQLPEQPVAHPRRRQAGVSVVAGGEAVERARIGGGRIGPIRRGYPNGVRG